MICSDKMAIAAEAAKRWHERERVRAGRKGKTTAEVESPERLQAGLERLAQAATRQVISPSEPLSMPDPSVLRSMGLERVVGANDFQGIAFLELALAVSRFVGRINIRSTASRHEGYGTGFMVSPRLLLTNNHVLPDASTARFSEVEFDYQNDRFGRPLRHVPFELKPEVFFMTDEPLDFTLVAVAEQSRIDTPLRHYGWSRLIRAQGKILIGNHLNIIQHPNGDFKQFVSRSNTLVDVFDDYLHYLTDTERGSSGSPVYNDQWEVVALHHSGVPRMENGKHVARNGKPWDGRDPEDIDWVANEGIRVSSLVRHIEAQPLDGQKAALRDELLNLEPPNPLEAARLADGEARPDARPAPVSPGPASQDAPGLAAFPRRATLSLDIPLRITVEIGETLAAAQPGGGEPPVDRAQDGDAAAPGRPPQVEAALAELARAASRDYYDPDEDGKARDDYYEGLDVDALDDGALFDALSDLLERSHASPLRYAPATHLYPWVDLRDNDPPAIKSIYSGKGFDPRDLIEEDARIEAERGRALEAMVREASSIGREQALATLEAALPFNCEHVVPQSWFGRKEPMRGDLHHLFACEVRCNSFRGNTPFFDFPDFAEAVRDACGRSEDGGFEPFAGKGAVARATLYFLLRYPGEINNSRREYREDRLDILLDWHGQHPVEDYERHRNAAIQEKQGNRNPLIDFPHWADRIDFARGLGGRDDRERAAPARRRAP